VAAPRAVTWSAVQNRMFSASDIADFLVCHHLTTLKRAEAAGEIKRPFFADPGIDLLRTLGVPRHNPIVIDSLKKLPLKRPESWLVLCLGSRSEMIIWLGRSPCAGKVAVLKVRKRQTQAAIGYAARRS